MFKLGQSSPLELPVIFLKWLFPFVDRYYSASNNPPDAYEHIYVGFVLSLIFTCLTLLISKIFILGVLITFLVHVIWKEVYHDNPKHPIGSMTDAQWINYKVDLIFRCFGFVMASPFIIASVLR